MQVAALVINSDFKHFTQTTGLSEVPMITVKSVFCDDLTIDSV